MATTVKSKSSKTTIRKAVPKKTFPNKKLTCSLKPTKIINNRYYFSETMDDFELPNLIEVQLESYEWFLSHGIKELLEEVTPVSDFSGKKMELHLLKHTIDKPKYDAQTAKKKNISYEANLKVHVRLINKKPVKLKNRIFFWEQYL